MDDSAETERLPRLPCPAATHYSPPAAVAIRLGGAERRACLHVLYDCDPGTAADVILPGRPGPPRRYSDRQRQIDQAAEFFGALQVALTPRNTVPSPCGTPATETPFGERSR